MTNKHKEEEKEEDNKEEKEEEEIFCVLQTGDLPANQPMRLVTCDLVCVFMCLCACLCVRMYVDMIKCKLIMFIISS